MVVSFTRDGIIPPCSTVQCSPLPACQPVASLWQYWMAGFHNLHSHVCAVLCGQPINSWCRCMTKAMALRWKDTVSTSIMIFVDRGLDCHASDAWLFRFATGFIDDLPVYLFLCVSVRWPREKLHCVETACPFLCLFLLSVSSVNLVPGRFHFVDENWRELCMSAHDWTLDPNQFTVTFGLEGYSF